MKQTEKKRIIVPYGMNLGGPVLGDTANQISGLPLFISEEPEEDLDEL